ncbi:MAG TPA: hypothetical protein VLF68_04570 [Candidatus Saccharimonadales bacterium]|nr:hypothetical protein [Candidatus Saccharimonadales bacterium]
MQKGLGTLPLFLGVVILASVILAGGLPYIKKDYLYPGDPKQGETILQDISPTPGKNLQLYSPQSHYIPPPPTNVTPTSSTITPPPVSKTPNTGSTCPGHDWAQAGPRTCTCEDNGIYCQGKRCDDQTFRGNSIGCRAAGQECLFLFPNDGTFCWGKPVIYLYPQHDTVVNVKLDIPGTVIVSDPKYPDQTGWQNVLAHPDGTLEYQNKTYHELFYETAVTKKVTPQTGLLVSSKDLQTSLTTLTSRLGLLPNEQKEFMEYWMPKLNKLNAPYIFVSVLTQQQKDSIDHVDISPKPDVFIEMLFVFKPLTSLTSLTPLTLPTTPKRVGFTAVEWGGTIDE